MKTLDTRNTGRTYPWRGWLLVLVKAIISLLLLIWLARKVSPAQVWQVLSHAKFAPILGAFILLGVSLLLSGWRWHLAAQKRLPAHACVRFTWIAHFYGLVLPGALSGDLVKGFLLASRKGAMTGSELAASIVLDRAAGLGSLLVLGLASAQALPDMPRPWLLAATALAAVGLIITPWLVRQLLPFFFRRAGFLQRFAESLGSVSWPVWARVLGYSIVIHLVNVTFYWLTLQAIGEAESWWRMGLYTCLVNVVLLLPITVAGLGLREHLSVEFLHGALDSQLAVGFSLLILLLFAAHAVIGLAWQWLPREVLSVHPSKEANSNLIP